MQATLIENNGNGRIAYDSLLMSDPEAFSALGNKIAIRIIKLLSEYPMSAIDVARKLKIHEQKIYYHTKKLEKAGIIYTISSEKRHGMTAKIFSVVSPVISTKLSNRGVELKENITIQTNQKVLELMSPFVTNNKLDSIIVVGDTYSHGKFDKGSDELNYMLDTLLFLGRFIDGFDKINSKLDVKIKENDLKSNLILIGNNKTNSLIERINSKLSLQFDNYGKETITSRVTGNIYNDPRVGFILKTTNPFNPEKKLFLIGGIGRRGAHAATLALTTYSNLLVESIKSFDDIVKVVKGFDSDGDDVIDSIKILE